MKSINEALLNKRKAAIESSMRISRNATKKSFEILHAPPEVKRKSSIIGSYIGISLLAIGGVSFIIGFSSIAIGLSICGLLTLGSNLVTLKFLKNK
ncbi:hypothetical protein [Bacillus massiliigorillae]|uniref:hypothetical protein n=1 Tax=Bacillus massiliigorillae TaxID=1243664 RepID=UPI00039B6202|nr:hypothetical protein [Bacillus massiliigorillae]